MSLASISANPRLPGCQLERLFSPGFFDSQPSARFEILRA